MPLLVRVWPAAWKKFRLLEPTCNENDCVRVEHERENVFTLTGTSQELSALVAGARMALAVMRSAPEPPPANAVALLERVLLDFDRARQHLGLEARSGG